MAVYNDEKLKAMEDEMNRFEEEIGLPLFPPSLAHGVEAEVARHVIGVNTYSQVQRQLEEQRAGPGGLGSIPGLPFPGAPGFHGFPSVIPPVGVLSDIPPPPPPPPPPPLLVPHQVRLRPPSRHPLRTPVGLSGQAASVLPQPPSFLSAAQQQQQQYLGQSMPSIQSMMGVPSMPTVVSATPMMYQTQPSETPVGMGGMAGLVGSDMAGLSQGDPASAMASEIQSSPATLVGAPTHNISEPSRSHQKGRKYGKSKETGLVACAPPQPPVPAPPPPVIPQQAMAPPVFEEPPSKKKKNSKKLVRTAGGQTWEDSSLNEWDEDDFRLFCGDLGNDVTDEMLTRVFSKYASFQKAKVVRDKRTNKTKGFGFVSFKDPQDFIKAMKEVNGRYVGSRPIKLRKSSWKNRCVEVVRKKEKEKQALIGLLTGR